MRSSVLFLAVLSVRLGMAAAADRTVHIEVDAAHPARDYKPVWNYFGADEPNYIYAPNGKRLLRELSEVDRARPVYFRPHNLLTTGNGEGSLKWGSTNVYNETPDGKPIYDWKITDEIFDALRDTHVKPLVEIGFMPEALSPQPLPYRHDFPAKPDVFTGWSYPPKDYVKWRALIVAWVKHLQERYGAAIDGCKWEVWNEPDIPYFHGSATEYFRLYDITTDAVRQVLPHAIVGGPASTGPSEKNTLLHDFLEHCARGVNAATGKQGAPLDFISFHPKGSPKFLDGHVRMGLGAQLRATDRGMQIVSSFPEYRRTPIILSETDPEGCAACKGPQNGYRNGALYGVSVAEMLARSEELAQARGVNLAGAVTWAFEFENQPWFAGFRELASNGVDKPVLNVFRMFGKLGEKQLRVKSSGARDIADIEANGVRGEADVNGIATRGQREVQVILWNYHDDDVPSAPTQVDMTINGIAGSRVHVRQYRMDQDHGNAYTAWLAMGSPQQPTTEQIAALRKASALPLLEEKSSENVRDGALALETSLPRQGVALYSVSW